MFKKIFLIILSFQLVQCTSTKKFDQKISEQNCEEAFDIVPEKQTDFRLISKVEELSKTLMSYSATGAAYTVQVLWDVTATTGAAVILCAPTIAVQAAASQNPDSRTSIGLCIPADIKKVQAPYLGRETYKKTKKWRCPDVDGISRSIRKVAQCYADRNQKDDRTKAFKALESVANSGSFYKCISDTERESFEKDYSALNQ
ncbi:MAG: hypothetical protein V4596_07705 [Bdellovibrionota bacterium]